MSTRERHAKFKARGWQYVFGVGLNGSNQLEIWAKPSGDLVYWSPASDDEGSSTDHNYIGHSDGHLSGEEWKDAARRKLRERSEEENQVLVGVKIASEEDVRRRVLPILTWDAPFFVGIIDQNYHIVAGALLDHEEVIPWLKARKGAPCVRGPHPHWGIGDYIERRHQKTHCGYYRHLCLNVPGQRCYSNTDFVNGSASKDPRPIVPIRYYGIRGRPYGARRLRRPSTAVTSACGPSSTGPSTRSA